jgi:hypothetical protein
MGIVTVEGINHESYGPQLRLNPQGASPPTAAYISADNQIGFFTSAVGPQFILTAIARVLLPGGVVSLNQYSFPIVSSRTGVFTQWNLPEGFLLTLAVYANTQSDRRQVFCQANLLQTGQTPPIMTGVLCAGYLSPTVPISFPVGVNQNNIDCYGNVKGAFTTIPGPGSNISEQIPANSKWRVISLTFDLTTSAAVANRDVYVQFTESGLMYFSMLANTASQTAGLTWHYQIAAGMALATSVAQGYVSAPFPTWTFMRFPGIMQTTIKGLQAGDVITNGAYQFEEWICP